MNQKMFALTQINMQGRLGQIGKSHNPLFINDRHLKCQIIDILLPSFNQR